MVNDLSAAAVASQAAGELARLTTVERHDVAVVLGSGWAPATDRIASRAAVVRADVSFATLPGFAPPAVVGHPGVVRSAHIAGKNVLLFVGRTHLYEGHGVDAVAHAVRVAAAAGCRQVVLTNASGRSPGRAERGTVGAH